MHKGEKRLGGWLSDSLSEEVCCNFRYEIRNSGLSRKKYPPKMSPDTRPPVVRAYVHFGRKTNPFSHSWCRSYKTKKKLSKIY